MTALRDHLAQELAAKVGRHGVVVWDDPDGAYRAVAAEVVPSGVAFHAFDGSWFGLRHEIEPLLAGPDIPDLVVYLPAKPPDRDPLEELRVVGTKWTIKLGTLIKQALAGQITNQRAEELEQQCSSLPDIEAALANGGSDHDARLVGLAGDGSTLSIATMILVGSRDSEIAEQGIHDAARSALASALGGDFSGLLGADLGRAGFRQAVLAWLFDAAGSLPTELSGSLGATTAAQRKTAIEALRRIRSTATSVETYVELARAAESDLHLGAVLDWSNAFETVDPTPVVEELALIEGRRRLGEDDPDGAKSLASIRLGTSWWARPDAPGGSEAAIRWRVIEALADLNLVLRVPVPSFATLEEVVQWYSSTGWAVDAAYRRSELVRVTAGASLDDVDSEFQRARHRYESWLDKVLNAATDALVANPALPADRLQRSIHRRAVAPGSGPLAFVLVDALRYELGEDLANRLNGLPAEVQLVAAVGTPPTITPVGMAAVLPNADTGLTIDLDTDSRLAVSIGGTSVRSVADRVQLLGHAHGKVADLKLDDVAQYSNKELRKKVADASLVLVRSTEIDADGEGDQLATSWGGFDTTLAVLHTAVAKLLSAGIRRVVLTADHGFLAVRQLGEERRIDKPSTGNGELHRRAWIGRGGTGNASTAKVPLAAFGIGGDLDVIAPRGLGVFTAGGGLQFFHGGLSPQELVVPVITVTAHGETSEPQYKVTMSVTGNRLTSAVVVVRLTMSGDLFTNESQVQLQLTQDGHLVGRAIGGEGFDPATATVMVLATQELAVTVQVTSNLTAGSTATLEVLDAASGFRLATLDVDVAANILVDDDLD